MYRRMGLSENLFHFRASNIGTRTLPIFYVSINRYEFFFFYQTMKYSTILQQKSTKQPDSSNLIPVQFIFTARSLNTRTLISSDLTDPVRTHVVHNRFGSFVVVVVDHFPIDRFVFRPRLYRSSVFDRTLNAVKSNGRIRVQSQASGQRERFDKVIFVVQLSSRWFSSRLRTITRGGWHVSVFFYIYRAATKSIFLCFSFKFLQNIVVAHRLCKIHYTRCNCLRPVHNQLRRQWWNVAFSETTTYAQKFQVFSIYIMPY